jgi:large subunit ribosomal protein L22
MAEEKKDTESQQKKPARKRTAAKKSASGSGGGSRARKPAAKKETAARAPAKKAAAKKPAAKKEPAKKTPAKPEAKPKSETKPKRAKKEAPERPVVSARARFVRVAPRKARLVADQVRGLPIEDALPLLRFSTRSAAQDIRKLIESAAANAENNHELVAEDLLIKDIHVDEGPTLRRYRPRALGRATRINKRTSHIAVALTP